LVLIVNNRHTGAARTSQKDLTKFQTCCRIVSRNMKDCAVVVVVVFIFIPLVLHKHNCKLNMEKVNKKI